MSDGHDTIGGEGGHAHGPTVAAYLIVFAALAVFTLVSYLSNLFVQLGWIGRVTSFVIILAVAVVKASLVGLIFMHLKFDWRKLYFLIVPVFILAAMMGMVLMPDIVLAWWK